MLFPLPEHKRISKITQMQLLSFPHPHPLLPQPFPPQHIRINRMKRQLHPPLSLPQPQPHPPQFVAAKSLIFEPP